MSYEEFQRAVMYFDAQDYQEAARILVPIVAEEPGNRAVVELLGRAYFHSAQLGRAEEAFRRLVEIDPCNGWAYQALARTLDRRNRGDEAEKYRRMARVMGAEEITAVNMAVHAAELV
ncbi:tetratricopeptide repeat protein [Sphaerisporangium rubeum]|uniref:Flp pilus assembly protein TadD n=2 Tax=Sphaerisporangium rubeum TaxID=321317 RepID=A0A7X0IEY5_9ACTN|nr:Flp pilus assembly protein TadD [Sphaerisporangium rubeum]